MTDMKTKVEMRHKFLDNSQANCKVSKPSESHQYLKTTEKYKDLALHLAYLGNKSQGLEYSQKLIPEQNSI